MTILTSIILVLVIVAGTAFLAYYMQRGTKPLKEFKMDFDNNKEAQELVELSKELYNKDLRPIVAKKAPKKDKVTAGRVYEKSSRSTRYFGRRD